jgi:hypothetical protein
MPSAAWNDDQCYDDDGGCGKPVCPLIGTDGNVFAIIGTVKACLTDAGLTDEADRFAGEAVQQHSYDEVLALVQQYVTVV